MIDTSVLIDRVSEGSAVTESISIITLIEYPMVLEYRGFSGRIFYPDEKDFNLALCMQEELRSQGRMKGSSDLIIAAICINNNQKLITRDSDFDDISRISKLKLTRV